MPVVRGDAVTGAGLDEALDAIDVAYFLIHSMEGAPGFPERERAAARNFAAAAARAGVRRVVYLGGIVPEHRTPSRHLASRLEVERILLAALPEAVALRASIVIGASSRSFRFLVRLVERTPVWRCRRGARTARSRSTCATCAPCSSPRPRPRMPPAGCRWTSPGPRCSTYEAIIQRIADLMLVRRPALRFGRDVDPDRGTDRRGDRGRGSRRSSAPLMESLSGDLLPRDDHAAALLGVRLHRFDRAVEAALREWESAEPPRAR